MWIRGIFRLVSSLGIAAAMFGSAAAETTVKIGMVMPLTGTLASAGKQVVAGARLYVADHGNMVAGKQIELVVKDDGTSFDVGKRLIQEAIANHGFDVLAGGTTGDLLASAPIITDGKMPTVIMLSSTSAVIDKSPYFVRTSCTLAQSSAIVAEWAAKNGIKRVVTLVSDFSPGHEAEARFKDRYLASGGEIAESIESLYKIRILHPFCSALAMTLRRPYSSSFPRSRSGPSPNSSSNVASTRRESG